MMGVSDGERISMIRSAVLIKYTRVTDRRTDGKTDRRTDGIGVAYMRYSMLSRVKMMASAVLTHPIPFYTRQNLESAAVFDIIY